MKKDNKRSMRWTLQKELIKSFFLKKFQFLRKKTLLSLPLLQEDTLAKLQDKTPFSWIQLRDEEILFLFDQTLIQYDLRKKTNLTLKDSLKSLNFSPLSEKNIRFLYKQYLKEISRTDFLVQSASLHRRFIVNHLFSEAKSVHPLSSIQLKTIIEHKKVIILSNQSELLLSKVKAIDDELLMKKINKNTMLTLPSFEEEHWFDILDQLKVEVMKQDFDIILLDIGLLNVHLAWFVKSMSRQSIVLNILETIQ
jgi:hypothetical protein